MRNYKDESFIAQYLSPKLMRDMRMFAVLDDEARSEIEVSAIHNERGFLHMRRGPPGNTTSTTASPTSRSGRSTRAATVA
jgi:spore cortex formation protein SpoVR/YcgB (stage V sporulation)